MSEVMERTDSAGRDHDSVSEHREVIRSIEPAVADHLKLLLPIDRAWQPTDYLPDLEAVSWRDEVERFRWDIARPHRGDHASGRVPLVVPLTLFAHHIRRCAVPYLADQIYLRPHPVELMPRNHV